TLTAGKPKLVRVEPAEGFSQEELLRLAAAVERGSEHPLAAAVVKGAEVRGVQAAAVQDFQAGAGKGVMGKVEGRTVVLGNVALLAEHGVDAEPYRARMDDQHNESKTVLLAAVDGRFAGLLCVGDPIPYSTQVAVPTLHADGMRIIML